ncbi:Uncharacterised protein [Staphylococcus aureus]|nr:Uncharacterised protein [Staphylococcus aureus]
MPISLNTICSLGVNGFLSTKNEVINVALYSFSPLFTLLMVSTNSSIERSFKTYASTSFTTAFSKYPGLLKVVTIITLIFKCFFLISAKTSSPVMPGISISKITTLGLYSSISFIASRPLSVSAKISKSPCSLIN